MSAAILFYGYDLGTPDNGWGIQNGEDFEPAWLLEAEEDFRGDSDGEGYEFYMCRTLLLADGVPYPEITPENSDDLLKERCSLEIFSFGHSNTLFYGLALAGSRYLADDWSAKAISPDFEWNPTLYAPGVDFADDGYLHNALRTLGMTPIRERASWLLAPDE